MVSLAKHEVRATERFLNSGVIGKYSAAELVGFCDRRVRSATQVSAADSIHLASRFVNRCRNLSVEHYLTALRAAGWAYLVAGKYRESLRAYKSARRLVLTQPLTRARIDRTLIDVYMYLGNTSRAQDCAQKALKTFRSLKAADDIARTRVNLANLLHRQDRHREAYSHYHAAARHFEDKGDMLSTALCWYNEANTHVQLFDFETAEQLYSNARTIFQEHGHLLHSTGCLYGLAWLNMLNGDFHVALKDLAACESFYGDGKLRRETVLCLLDRAESYLGLNLLADARRSASEAAKGARKLGIRYEEAKAAFFTARASMGMHRIREARTYLSRAERLMKSEKNLGFTTAIQVSKSLLGTRDRRRGENHSKLLANVRSAQLPLWEAICDIELISGTSSSSQHLRRLGHNPAVKTIPHLLAQYETLLGDKAAEQGKMSQASTRWERAAEVLEAVRTKLPPIEMRSSFAKTNRDPFHRLIKLESRRNPRKAAAWVERSKTVGIWSPTDESLAENPGRTRVQQSMSDLARHVAAVSAITGGQSGRRSALHTYQLPIFARLREQVRHDLAAIYAENTATIKVKSQASRLLEDISREMPVLQFHLGLTDIHAFLSYRGQCQVHTYENGVNKLNDLVARWRFFVECAPANARKHRKIDLQDESELLDRISEWLIEPLALPESTNRLLVVPEGRLFCLPWAALRYRGRHLYESYRPTLTPSLRHFAQIAPSISNSKRACIFVGLTDGLPWLNEEVDLIKKRFASLPTELYSPCRREDWPEGSSASMWHFAGHAQLRSDNPFYSSLLLDDGEMFAADFRLRKNQVDVVTLAACRTGQQTGLPGEETSGLVRAMLEMGARTVIAGGWAVSDRSTALWMDSFYAALLAGHSSTESVKHAIDTVRSDYPSAFHWAAFSIFGAGQ